MDADTTRGLQAAARDAVGLSAARAAGGGAPPGGVSMSSLWAAPEGGRPPDLSPPEAATVGWVSLQSKTGQPLLELVAEGADTVLRRLDLGGCALCPAAADAIAGGVAELELENLRLGPAAAPTEVALAGTEVRKTPSWPRSWAIFSLL